MFEVKGIDQSTRELDLFDLLEKKSYKLIDIGFSHTANPGGILATRLIPIEGAYMTSGLSFAFEENKRLRLLAEISKERRRIKRLGRKKVKANKREVFSLLRVMFQANRKWGIEVVTIDP